MPLNNDMAMATKSKHAQFIRSDFFRVHRTQGRRTRTLANIKDVSSHLPLTFFWRSIARKHQRKGKTKTKKVSAMLTTTQTYLYALN